MNNMNKVDFSYQMLLSDLLEKLLKNSLEISKSEYTLCEEIYKITASKVVGIFHKTESNEFFLRTCYPNRRSDFFEDDFLQSLLSKAFQSKDVYYWNAEDEDVISNKYNLKNCVVIPLVADKEFVGALIVLNLSLTDNINSVIRTMEMLSKILGIMLKNIYIQGEKEIIYNALVESEAKFKSIVNNAQDIVYTINKDATLNFISPITTKILGYEIDELIGKSIFDYLHKDGIEICKTNFDLLFEKKKEYNLEVNRSLELRFLDKNNTYIWFSVRNNLIKIKNEDCILGIARDITNKKESELKLYELATYDNMTKVLNRRSGLLSLDKELLTNIKNNSYLSLIFIDINDLKFVNDNFGHEEGDFYIITICKIIKTQVRKTDFICRMGGDEFMIILPNCTADNAEEIAKKIVLEIDDFNDSWEGKYKLSISYGCSISGPQNSRSSESLIKIADSNMYAYKKNYKEKQRECRG